MRVTEPSLPAKAAVTLLLFARALSAQGPPPVVQAILGSWKLNVDRTSYDTGQRLSRDLLAIRKYEDHGGGFLLHTMTQADPHGNTLFLLTVARLDGKDYPTYTTDALASLLTSGAKTSDTVAFRIADPHTLEYTDKREGRVIAVGTCTISTDGKTMTETVKTVSQGKLGTRFVRVYDKL